MDEPLVVDSAARLDSRSAGRVAVCGSHAGLYPAWLAARAHVRAVVLNDAGPGKDAAGIAGLEWLQQHGIAACALDHASARIGDGADLLASGKVSHVNAAAAALGCKVGVKCREAVAHLQRAHPFTASVPDLGEARHRIPTSGHREVWALDSVALVRAEDRRAVVVTGSHGGLLGGHSDDGVLAIEVFAVLFNDAGGGKDGAGFSRLSTLDARGVAGATVAANSARIGDGRSTYETGILSHTNALAERLGLEAGMSARQAVARLVGLA